MPCLALQGERSKLVLVLVLIVCTSVATCWSNLWFLHTRVNDQASSRTPVVLESFKDDSASLPGLPSPYVALCFFGLTRSLKITLPSIQKNIIAPLKKNGFKPTIFLHTYDDTDDHSSSRTAANEWRELNATEAVLTSQHAFLDGIKEERASCWKHGTGWKEAPEIVQKRNLDNVLCQLNSLQHVAELWQRHSAASALDYQAVVFLRPDVHYQDPLPVSILLTIKEGEVYIPNWAHHGGVNDRFAMLAPRSAARWKGRLEFALHHCLKAPLHAERFAMDFAISRGFQVHLMSQFEFMRVRSNGDIAVGDTTLPKYRAASAAIKQRLQNLPSTSTSVNTRSLQGPLHIERPT